jgi:hypothetical protein
MSNLKKIKVCIKRQADRESAVPPQAGAQDAVLKPLKEEI